MDLEALLTTMPFAELAGVRLVSAGRAECVARLDWDAARVTLGGAMHGGALMTLADTAGAVCAFLNLPEARRRRRCRPRRTCFGDSERGTPRR